MARGLRLFALILLVFFGACTTLPTAPSVMALPGAGKTVAQFRADDYGCRQFAGVEAGGQTTAYDMQWGYDGVYMQCMYAKGHKVPVGGALPSVSPPADYTPLYPPPSR